MSTTRIARHAGTAAALGFMLLFFVLAAAFLSSCAAQHQLTPQRPPRTEPVSQFSQPASATVSAAPYEAAPGYLAAPPGARRAPYHCQRPVPSRRPASARAAPSCMARPP